MSVSEKRPSEELGAINKGHTMAGLKVLPIFRKTGPKAWEDDAFSRARDIERVMDALPQIVAVVEQLEDNQWVWNEAWECHECPSCRKKEPEHEENCPIERALTALEKALNRCS